MPVNGFASRRPGRYARGGAIASPAPGAAMTRITIIVSLWLLLVGTISDSATTPGGTHRPLELLALYVVVTLLAVGALWLHLAEDPADSLHPPRRQPFRWD
jgi:hypothetical protein